MAEATLRLVMLVAPGEPRRPIVVIDGEEAFVMKESVNRPPMSRFYQGPNQNGTYGSFLIKQSPEDQQWRINGRPCSVHTTTWDCSELDTLPPDYEQRLELV